MVRAPIHGPTLNWARTEMNLSPDELATVIGSTAERIRGFETEETQPTLKQLEKIASKLDRTVAFFFAPPPQRSDVPKAPDFRGRGADPIPPQLSREMRRAEQHRDTVLELDGANLQGPRIGRVTWENHRVRAAQLRAELGLTDGFLPSENKENQVFHFWRGQLEQHGYLVFQTTRIPLDVFRGLSLQHETLPIILLNGADSNNAKVFTLFHELAHLANRTSGLCLLNDDVREESLANAFAASVLMPESQVRQVRQVARGAASDPTELATAVAAALRVSVLAAAIRLHTLGIIGERDVDDVRAMSDANWARAREAQRSQKGGPEPWRLRYRDLGPTYLGTIARALETERLDLLDASYLTNAKIPMVQQMLAEYYRSAAQR